jgi:hypothetical protein
MLVDEASATLVALVCRRCSVTFWTILNRIRFDHRIGRRQHCSSKGFGPLKNFVLWNDVLLHGKITPFGVCLRTHLDVDFACKLLSLLVRRTHSTSGRTKPEIFQRPAYVAQQSALSTFDTGPGNFRAFNSLCDRVGYVRLLAEFPA